MDAVDAIRGDLATIVDQARWAHVHGYWKSGRGLDAERGVSLTKSEEEKLNNAATFDIEMGGDYGAREAYEHAVNAVARADVLLASLVEGPQRPLLRLLPFSSPSHLATVAANAAWRLEHMTVKNPRRVAIIRASLDRAVRGLSKAMGDGKSDPVQKAEVLCRTCKIRPRAEHVTAKGETTERRQGECETCARYRARSGHERPVSLDHGTLASARAAQARRGARDEGYGAA